MKKSNAFVVAAVSGMLLGATACSSTPKAGDPAPAAAAADEAGDKAACKGEKAAEGEAPAEGEEAGEKNSCSS